MEEFVSKVWEIDYSFLLVILLELGALGSIYWIIQKYKSTWKTPVILIITVLIIRILAFQNPLAWYIYSHTLDPNVIGWRQSSVLFDKLSQYKKYENIDYLAIGSSQTGFIYNPITKYVPNLMIKSLAGLGPVDLFMYRYSLLNYEPRQILLYLSDFDMGRKPDLNAIKLNPSQGIYASQVFVSLISNFPGDLIEIPFKEMIVGEFLPEYKYSFIFKGYKDQLFNKSEVFPNPAEQISQEELQKIQLRRLQEAIESHYIYINFYYLTRFLVFCKEQDISVLIIEGQYHPAGYSQKNLAIRALVRKKMREMAHKYENVTFVEGSKIMTFEASDYLDAYHVKPDAGKKFAKKVFTLVDTMQNFYGNK